MDARANSKALSRLVALVADGYPVAALEAAIKKQRVDIVAPQGSHSTVVALLNHIRAEKKLSRVQLVVAATGREAEDIAATLRGLDPEAEILEFPSWETLPHERLSPSPETVGRRVSVLQRLSELKTEHSDHSVYVLASVRAVLQPVIAGLANHPALALEPGKSYFMPELTLKLVELAYERVDMVTKRGEFAARGGILDIFPTTASHAVRLEFFGDELEDIREFSVTDQRSLPLGEEHQPVKLVTLYPAREIVITPSVASRAREMMHEFPNLSTMLTKIAEGMPVEGMESLAPVLCDALVPLASYLPEDTAVTILSPEKSAARAQSLTETNEEFLHAAWDAAIEGATAPIDLSAGGFKSLDEFERDLGKRPLYRVSTFDSPEEGVVNLGLLEIPNFTGLDMTVLQWIEDQTKHGQQVFLVAEGHGTAQRIEEQLVAKNLKAEVLQATLKKGFAAPASNLIVLTEADFYGKNSTYVSPTQRKLATKRGAAVDPLTLKPGDYVVHEVHGIGRFVELVRRRSGIGKQQHEREYLLIEYAPSKRGGSGDTLFVPTDHLDLLTRYVGGEAPVLSKMGGSDWARQKGNARKAVRKIAIDLVKLYSARMSAVGHAFGPDTPWQREMEEAFQFVETPDQLSTIEEVKRDMERAVPMDRLLAGDVGYGKTEVAVRAAFKAIQDGKQVAVLVPTTLLVRQHTDTFVSRYAGFPVNVRSLSRFQSDKEVKETIKGLKDGTVDLVIGTHRLLMNNIEFKNLGLLVIDEEQRFGVEHKEKLKDFKMNVDVLSMSATPIPRTLELAVTGIREMSTLATPPEDRHPILTYVGGYSEKQVAAAIRRELIREGQVFFVHNRVESIDKVASQIRELVPEARVAVAHGQMSEGALEQVVVDFWERKFDVLVSTTIIETGIDIPNANTLIVDRAERFGLSQLHQIRGRVGRSRERAYAYFFYDLSKPLTDIAHDRLATIATNNELGSGMQVALKDLEIRGAGNLLGGEQSGHIAGVGFDLYLRMIGEAVADFKGEKQSSPAELKLELPVDAHIPSTYLDSERLRLEAYHKLSAASNASNTRADLDVILEELEDRYGLAPQSVINLIDVTELRQQANRLGVKDAMMLGTHARISPVELQETEQVRLSHQYPGLKYLQSAKLLTVPLPKDSAGETLRDKEMIQWAWVLLAQVFSKKEAND
ncbi:MAG: transcription-repair coupling factor [Rhodoluna sp.]|nr:transcription-repair coupling factor [Rhodoluna sp.]